MIAKRFAIACLAIFLATPLQGKEAARIVYVGVADDPYYDPQPAYTGLSLKDRKRPVAGARVAMRETRVLSRALGIAFELEEVILLKEAPARDAVTQAREAGALAVLLDLPADKMEEVLAAEGDTDGLLFNIRHRERRWRSEDCAPALLHTLPSHDMLSDGLAQHLRFRGWERVLLLRGTMPEDHAVAAAVRRSIRKFGLTLADDQVFELSNDPRQRDLNNIALLTGHSRHDVVWVVDSEGEFGRYVPYATYAPRPVVGSEGLVPQAWHWTYERHGAPQLNQRFRRLTDRDMTSQDWAAWVAVRAVVEAVQRLGSADPEEIAAFVRSDQLSLDLYKGVPGSFRSWNGQLRQPILLATHNAVISSAPMSGFEHRTNTLDTLGIDRPESECRR